jgi:hypothetical protein
MASFSTVLWFKDLKLFNTNSELIYTLKLYKEMIITRPIHDFTALTGCMPITSLSESKIISNNPTNRETKPLLLISFVLIRKTDFY